MKIGKTFFSIVNYGCGMSPKNCCVAVSMLVIGVYLSFTAGCSYYKVRPIEPRAGVIEEVQRIDKYVILHQGGSAWHLNDVVVSDGGQELQGILEPLSPTHSAYKTRNEKKKVNRYRKSGKHITEPTHEVHVYASGFNQGKSGITVPYANINKIEVYDPAVGATVFSHVGTILLSTAVVVLAVIAATKSSCPFAYVSDGDEYAFAGELYGGAIYSSLERDDYLPLPGFKPAKDKYELRISNELKERQYTNLANLIVVGHPENSTVLIDKYGGIQTIMLPEEPVSAVSNNVDFQDKVLNRDSSSYVFDEAIRDDAEISNLTMTFRRVPNSTSGKLILNAKNSYWLDYAYGKFNEQFGVYFNTFSKSQKDVPAAENIQWTLDQGIPLAVYLETPDGWEFVDYFNSIGPLASRDLVMPIDLTKVKGDEVRIKLQCGFMFWEVDYAAMDFSETIPVEVSRKASTHAMDEEGQEVSALISTTDDQYLIQPKIGNVATIQYSASTPIPGQVQTVFLHSRGYYEYIRDYKNWPDMAYLQTFKKKRAFTRFAKQQYDEVTGADLLVSTLVYNDPQKN